MIGPFIFGRVRVKMADLLPLLLVLLWMSLERVLKQWWMDCLYSVYMYVIEQGRKRKNQEKEKEKGRGGRKQKKVGGVGKI